MALMALDLPALERPAKAISAPASGGNCAGAAALIRNRASSNRLMLSRGNEELARLKCTIRRPRIADLSRKENHAAEAESRLDGARRRGGNAAVFGAIARRGAERRTRGRPN